MITEFPELDALNAEFENCALIWHTAWDFLKVLPAWMDGPFSNLDAEEVQNNVEMWYKNSAKCCKVLTNESKIVAEETKRRVEKFQVRFFTLTCYSTLATLLLFLVKENFISHVLTFAADSESIHRLLTAIMNKKSSHFEVGLMHGNP